MIIILVFTFLVFCASLPTWGTYQPERIFSLLNTHTSQSIQFAIIQQSSAITFVEQVKRSTYDFHDGHHYFEKRIETQNNQTVSIIGEIWNKFNVTINLSGVKKVAILFTGRNNHSKIKYEKHTHQHEDLIIKSSMNSTFGWSTLRSIGVFDDAQIQNEGDSLILICESQTGKPQTINFHNGLRHNDPSIYKQEVEKKYKNFIKYYELSNQFKPIILHAIYNTIGSLSFRKTKDNQYIQLKSKYSEPDQKPNLGLSSFIIEILANFDHELREQLFNSLVERLQDESIYSSESHFFTPPQHTELFLKFPHSKSFKVLNSLIYHSLFHKVNHAIGHQSADYHSSKQIHPVLKKLLQISWQSDYNYLKGNSIYTESFIDDAYIHSEEEQIEISVSKTTWLLKTIRVIIQLNKRLGLLSIEQLSTLQSNLRQYFRSTCFSKQQKLFKSINTIERSRFYSRLVTYESFLPFIYKLQPKYEQSYYVLFKALKNLTTQRGVMSQQRSQYTDTSQYNFRGRIWPYFNYKIVQMLSTPQNLKDEYLAKDILAKGTQNIESVLEQIIKILKKIQIHERGFAMAISEGVKKQILSDWNRQKQLFSSWSAQGVTYNSNPELILINTLFLK